MEKLKKINVLFHRVYDFVSYWGVDEFTTDSQLDLVIMYNRYFASLTAIFLFLSISNFLFLGISLGAISLLIISLVFFGFFLAFRFFSENRFFIAVVFLLLTICITYYASFCGIQSGVFLYYFPLLFTLPVFFQWKEDQYIILVLVTFILSNIYVSAFTRFELVERNSVYQAYSQRLLIINITCVLLLFTINSIFLEEKRAYLDFMYDKEFFYRKKIRAFNTEIKHLRELLSAEVQSDENFDELIDSIQLNDSVFIKKFKKYFPYFFQKINDRSIVPLTISDLKFCALLKLNFTAKQIATYTNSSVKSVESKKYRLRKKLDVPKDVNITHYLSSI